MKAYLITSGTVFGFMTAFHIARIVAEGVQVLTHGFFVVLTVAAAGLCLWAWRLLIQLPRA